MNAQPRKQSARGSYRKVDMYDNKLAFSKSLGYANLAEAIAALTERAFNEQFAAYKKPNKKK